MYIYIYIYIALPAQKGTSSKMGTPNLPTNMVDFGGFHSSIMLCLRGGILMSIGNSPESLSQAMLVGVMLPVCCPRFVFDWTQPLEILSAETEFVCYYPSTKGCLGIPTLGTNLGQHICLCELGVHEHAKIIKNT